MRRNAFNVVIFMFLAGLMFFLWQQAEKNLPKPAAKKDDAKPGAVEDQKAEEAKRAEVTKKIEEEARLVVEKRNALTAAAGGPALAGRDAVADAAEQARRAEQKKKADEAKRVAAELFKPPTLVAMGDHTFYNRVLLTTRGGGVQQVVLPRFDQADRLGRQVNEKDAAGNPTKVGVPLHLVPGVVHPRGKFLREDYRVPDLRPGTMTAEAAAGLAEPSYTVFHYPTPEDDHPDPLLGERSWKVVSEERPEGGEHRVVFETELGAPHFLKLRKIYTLAPTDYHVGLRLEVERLPGGEKGKGQTRLQISGPRGLPIEGEWYATTYRNAIVGWLDKKGTPRRQLEEAATIGNKRGGEAVNRGENQFKYMVVATQFFASGVAVDDRADNSFEKGQKNPWARVRATTEIPIGEKQDPSLPYFDDVTVRAASETIDLAPGEKLSHSYLLYNGPSKVRLLKLMSDARGKVDPALVDRYKDDLALQTITDFRSDTWLGWFANFIYWTDLVIVFTNLMHLFLAAIHALIPSWALSIVVLTVCVRLVLFYPSRKQTAMSMRMMEVQKKLQPEFDKLHEKYKDDLHTYNREKTRLMMQHGANPFAAMGGCLLLLAQMPIMMGLYFCLQESVFFRLDSFLWVNNLAAPDMLVWWTETIPFISTPGDIGSFTYLGPYFNLLPVLAVGLMLYQQAKMMPPSTDPQAEQQRMMMKMMMVMMAVFFYKVAAGLALYFIVSTLWGIIERQFIPKPVINLDGGGATADLKPKAGSPNGRPGAALSPTAAAAVAEAQQKSKGFLGRLREALQRKMEEMQKQADEMSKRQIRNDPGRPDGADGSPGQDGGGSGGNRRDRDKKKRRRK